MIKPDVKKESFKEKHDQLKKKLDTMLNETRGQPTEEEVAMLDIFLASDSHLSVSEFEDRVREQMLDLDRTNVKKFLSLLVDYGIAHQSYLRGELRYEHFHLDEHHDHLICLKCGGIETFLDDEIELRQVRNANHRGFSPLFHCLEIHGICGECRNKLPKTLLLTKAFQGETLVVRNVSGGNSVRSHLMAMGIINGTKLKVAHAHGKLLVLVRGTRIVLDWKTAGKIEVERVLPPLKEDNLIKGENT